MKTRSQSRLRLAIVAGAGPAFAVDEIVVTAQRREEKLQDVPLAVSAFNADSIAEPADRRGQGHRPERAEPADLHGDGGRPGDPGPQPRRERAEPRLQCSPSRRSAFTLDDVYFGRLASANLDLSDIERIEVLRGPQGTLYGRNTIAGAIKIISRTPGNDSWLDGSLGLGNFDTFKVTGSVGGPIAERRAGRLRVGRLRQPQPGLAGQLRRRTPSPGDYDNKVDARKLHLVRHRELRCRAERLGREPGERRLQRRALRAVRNPPGPDENFQPAPDGGGKPLGGFYNNFSPAGVNYGKSNQCGANLTLSCDFGGITLRSITGYVNIDDKFGFDLAGGGFLGVPGTPGLLIASDSNFDQVSEEFQLLGTAFDARLNWLVGLYYLNEDGTQHFSGDLFGPAFAEDIHNETDSYAAFADGTLTHHGSRSP